MSQVKPKHTEIQHTSGQTYRVADNRAPVPLCKRINYFFTHKYTTFILNASGAINMCFQTIFILTFAIFVLANPDESRINHAVKYDG